MEIIESIVNKERLKTRNANGMVVLKGSQTFNMMQGVTQSLAGRTSILKMQPLSYKFATKTHKQAFECFIHFLICRYSFIETYIS